MDTIFSPAEVATFEHATWSRCAPGYEEGFAILTREAVDPLLDAARVRPGARVLDLGTGTGTVAAAAQRRGASVTGVDFSEEMLAKARQLVPEVQFRAASADALPFDDASFDAVAANTVLHHLARPVQSLAEAHRVLAADGRIACTVWAAPERLEAFGLFFAAVAEHAGDAELPHGPLFGVTDAVALTGLFAEAGFSQVTIDDLPTAWRLPSIEVLLDALGTWAQLDSFPAQTRQGIAASVRSAAATYETGAGLVIPNPMLLIAATKTT